MSIPLSAFYDYLLPDVPGVEPGVAASALLRAAILVCEKGRALKEAMQPLAVTAGIANYDLLSPSGLRVLGPAHRLYSEAGRGLAATNPAFLSERYGAAWPTLSGTASHFFQTKLGSLQLFMIPSEDDTLHGDCFVSPPRNAATLPEVLFNDYAELVTLGAKGLLYGAPAKSYSNPPLASALGEAFNEACWRLKLRQAKGLSEGPLRSFSQPF